MALWPAPRGRMDDWSVSAKDRTAASGEAPNPPKPVTLTQARFFMDDGTWPPHAERATSSCRRAHHV
jgi:hypothetical protein